MVSDNSIIRIRFLFHSHVLIFVLLHLSITNVLWYHTSVTVVEITVKFRYSQSTSDIHDISQTYVHIFMVFQLNHPQIVVLFDPSIIVKFKHSRYFIFQLVMFGYPCINSAFHLFKNLAVIQNVKIFNLY